MYQSGDTIYALSSGLGTAGVAVIRLSGPHVLSVLEKMCSLKNPKPNYAYFRSICSDEKVLDKGLVRFFYVDFMSSRIRYARSIFVTIFVRAAPYAHTSKKEHGNEH